MVVKNSAKVRLWLPVAALSIGIGWGVALGCANSTSQLPSSESQPPAESGAMSTPELLARVGQAYERGLDQISDAESDQLMDDLGDLGRRAGAGDAAAFRGLAALPLDGAYGEVAVMGLNSNADLSKVPAPETANEARILGLVVLEMDAGDEDVRTRTEAEASGKVEALLSQGESRGLRYGPFRNAMKGDLLPAFRY